MDELDKKDFFNAGHFDDEELTMNEVIQGEADLCYLHHYLSEVFRQDDDF